MCAGVCMHARAYSCRKYMLQSSMLPVALRCSVLWEEVKCKKEYFYTVKEEVGRISYSIVHDRCYYVG